jgi:hypothetical protein
MQNRHLHALFLNFLAMACLLSPFVVGWRPGTKPRVNLTRPHGVFKPCCVDIEICHECGGRVKVIACEAPVVIQKILD